MRKTCDGCVCAFLFFGGGIPPECVQSRFGNKFHRMRCVPPVELGIQDCSFDHLPLTHGRDTQTHTNKTHPPAGDVGSFRVRLFLQSFSPLFRVGTVFRLFRWRQT